MDSLGEQTQDKVVLVNEQDEVIGVADKVDAHRGEALLHRASSVFLFRVKNNQVKLLIQQRSDHKIVGQRQWANTCCGNVWPGEAYEQCARRRLSHELGITQVELIPLVKFQYQVACNAEFSEREIDQLYAGWYDGEIKPNATEVIAVEWVDWQSVVAGTLDYAQAPWFVHMLSVPEVRQALLSFVSETKVVSKE